MRVIFLGKSIIVMLFRVFLFFSFDLCLGTESAVALQFALVKDVPESCPLVVDGLTAGQAHKLLAICAVTF